MGGCYVYVCVCVYIKQKIAAFSTSMIVIQHFNSSTNDCCCCCCCLPPNVKGEWVDTNFQIIDLLVQPRAAGVAGTLIFVHIANFATLQPWLHVGSFTCRIFNSLHTHKGPVLLCAPPRHRAMWLNFLAQGKSLPPAGIELGTFGLQRSRVSHVSHCASKTHINQWLNMMTGFECITTMVKTLFSGILHVHSIAATNL